MKRMNQFVYALLIGCVLLTGCGSNTNTTETKEEVISDSQANASTEATQSESASEEENDSVTGRIESIDETSITLAVMNMPVAAAIAIRSCAAWRTAIRSPARRTRCASVSGCWRPWPPAGAVSRPSASGSSPSSQRSLARSGRTACSVRSKR